MLQQEVSRLKIAGLTLGETVISLQEQVNELKSNSHDLLHERLDSKSLLQERTLKIEYLSDIRRLNIPIDYASVRQAVMDSFALEDFQLKYQDDEGDLITVLSDLDVVEGLSFAQVLKLRVIKIC